VGERWRSREQYPCDGYCQQAGRWLDDKRGLFRCALPGFDERRWDSETKGGFHMGGLPILDGPDASQEPKESHDEGCPGAWYRSRFAASLMAYERPVSEHGVYSENPLLTRCDDPLVLEAIQYLEHERARARALMRERQAP
jgi:hypothetical protein